MAHKAWTVVEFIGDGSVAAVPSNWLAGSTCYWPPYKPSRMAVAIKNCEPRDESCEKHAVSVFPGGICCTNVFIQMIMPRRGQRREKRRKRATYSRTWRQQKGKLYSKGIQAVKSLGLTNLHKWRTSVDKELLPPQFSNSVPATLRSVPSYYFCWRYLRSQAFCVKNRVVSQIPLLKMPLLPQYLMYKFHLAVLWLPASWELLCSLSY